MRKTKILLLSPPFVKHYMRNARCDFVSNSSTQWYPIWLGYCGALLEKKKYQVRLIDAPAEDLTHDQVMGRFLDFKPDLLVVYTGKLSEENDIQFTDRLLDRWACSAVLVGPFFSIDPERVLAASKKVSLGITGEFEFPILEYLEGKNVSNISNFISKQKGEIHSNPPRPYLTQAELDSIPFVSEFLNRHAPFKFYRTTSEPYPFMDLMTGRGCQWGQCTFCLWVHSFIKGRVYQTRSFDSVMEEIIFVERHLPWFRSIMIQDDTFPAERAREFAQRKIEKGLNLSWSCYARGNIDKETLDIMARSNCRNLHVGFESGSGAILKNIKKGITKQRMTRFARDAKQAGLKIHGDFAIGFPGETRESIKSTIDWACSIRPYTAQFQLMIPFPGTPFYDQLRKEGLMMNDAPNYPELSWDEMERWAKKAYIKFYLCLPFLRTALKHPRDLIFNKAKTYMNAIPSIFWRKWHVR